jgi:hypothetical protein
MDKYSPNYIDVEKGYMTKFVQQTSEFVEISQKIKGLTESIDKLRVSGDKIKKKLDLEQIGKVLKKPIKKKYAMKILGKWRKNLQERCSLEIQKIKISSERCHTYFSVVRLEHGINHTQIPDDEAIKFLLEGDTEGSQQNDFSVVKKETLKYVMNHFMETLENRVSREQQSNDRCKLCNNKLNVWIENKCSRVKNPTDSPCNCPKSPYIICSDCFIGRCTMQYEIILNLNSKERADITCVISCSECRGSICPYDTRIVIQKQSLSIQEAPQYPPQNGDGMTINQRLNNARSSINNIPSMIKNAESILNDERVANNSQMSDESNRGHILEMSSAISTGFSATFKLLMELEKSVAMVRDSERRIIDSIESMKYSINLMDMGLSKVSIQTGNVHTIKRQNLGDSMPLSKRRCGLCHQIGHYKPTCQTFDRLKITNALMSIPGQEEVSREPIGEQMNYVSMGQPDIYSSIQYGDASFSNGQYTNQLAYNGHVPNLQKTSEVDGSSPLYFLLREDGTLDTGQVQSREYERNQTFSQEASIQNIDLSRWLEGHNHTV